MSGLNNPWVIIVIAVGLAIGIWYAGTTVWPNTNEMEENRNTLAEQVQALQKEVEEGRALQARLPELQREIKGKEDELEQLKDILPPDPDTEGLIRKMEGLAVESRLNIENFVQQHRVDRDFYYEVPFAIRAAGSYHNLANFFAKLGNLKRIINVSNVRIARAAGRTAADRTIDANFTATTYVYLENAARTP